MLPEMDHTSLASVYQQTCQLQSALVLNKLKPNIIIEILGISFEKLGHSSLGSICRTS